MKINGIEIGGRHTFVIAEIGNNHNGSLERAKQMVDLVQKTGADCVKFQMRHMEETYRNRTLKKSGDDLGTEYVLDLLERFQITNEEHKELSEYCKEKGILYLCTPWDLKSIDVLETFHVEAYKVSSADLTNLPLLDRLAMTKKPLILSSGMSTTDEVKKTINFLNSKNVEFAILHCNSTYPAPLHDINLKWINGLKKLHSNVGYSGHERGISVSLAATAMGSSIIERHFTLDRNMEGPDHAASLEFNQFSDLVSGIREIEQSLGTGEDRIVSQGEMINRENLGKSLVSSSKLSKGTIIEASHIKVRSPGQGLSPQSYDELIGKTLKRDMNTEDFFFDSDIKEESIEPKEYSFRRPWGVPVRYHDFQEYSSRIKPDFFEFHFSFSDMDLDPSDYISKNNNMDFVVHAPELFANSQLMDLATTDNDYRNNSIKDTQRIIDITKLLKGFFPKTQKPMIVTNIGGFSMDEPLKESVKETYYNTFKNSLRELNMEGVEVIPQTMAPFPWHFGGQRYQNLFVKPDEIVKWCNELGLRMCFDVSHSMLTCNHYGFDFYEFAEEVSSVTAYLHMGDASGVNGEGLQIGKGDIDFKKLSVILNQNCPNAAFIPEIWQGHKNRGEGFWIGLNKLEGLL
jgi:sialic acid synthase SpsE/sugar phosphate isomerase/epimerase